MHLPAEPLNHARQTVAGPRSVVAGKRVLIGLDRWTMAGEAAEFLASILPRGFCVRMLTVVSYQGQWEGPWGRMTFADEAASQIAATESQEFLDARATLETAGARVSLGRRYGYPDEEILKEAEIWGASLVVLGHHNRSDGWFLGSVTESVVKRSRLPVLVVPSRAQNMISGR